MSNVLVTGAAGFLGSHLAMYHLKMGDDVWGVDDFSSSDPNSAHLKLLKKHLRFAFSSRSIIDEVTFQRHSVVNQKWMSNQPFDIIYNFACPASPPVYQSIPNHTLMTCVAGTNNVLELAQQDGAIVVHASTSEVYGDPTVTPQSERYVGNVNSYGPRSCYDEGKRAAEALCYDYKNTYGVDARLVRIFNTYGPNMDPHDGRVVTNFVKQALKGDELTVYGDGKQTRSFCYVDDLIEGIVRLGKLKQNPGTPVNIGNPHEFTMMELADAVLNVVFSDVNRPLPKHERMVTFRPLPQDDPTQRRPDITLARQLLGWEPKVSLYEGLKLMVPYMKSVLT